MMKNKKQLGILLVAVIVAFLYIRFGGLHDTATYLNSKLSEVQVSNSSQIDFLPTSTTGAVVEHQYYTLSYSEKHEQAEWVAYELLESQLYGSDFKRPFFIQDPKVKTASADWRNYKKSGYDKGHLCPAGDRKFSINAFEETFYTSNISPQLHAFNSGVWNRLEQKARYWAKKYHKIHVISGGVFSEKMKSIGIEQVSVPTYFYKIFGTEINGQYKMIAFLVPHQSSNKPLYEFVVSVDEIEKRTKIDFFPAFEDQMENRLEKNTDYKDWIFK
jgi:endonuclease G